MTNRIGIHRITILSQFLLLLIAFTLFSSPRATWADQVAASSALRQAKVIPKGDTLTVIQRPLLNIPALVTPGDTLMIECEAGSSTSGWTAQLKHSAIGIPLTILSASYDASTLWWSLRAQIPSVPLYELYDLIVTANGGIADTTWQAVEVIPEFRDDYYFIHITDTHLPTHLYYYESGADTDTSEMQDLRAVIDDINIINPEFVLLTGDAINEGELEDFLDKRYYTRTQKLLTEFQVPVYLTSGNHDIGGWDGTPPSDGTARREWWRFFGWKRLNDPPSGAPWYTQNYSFDYGPVHYVGMEAYINYDNWLPAIYGDESFTAGQMDWLDDDLATASGSASQVLFYHYDFSNQINLNSLGVEMALWGHIHYDQGSITSPPYDLGTDNVCDGNRSYRLIRVQDGTLLPTQTISAGSSGNNLTVQYSPANDGTHSQVIAGINNNFDERFEHAMLRFLMPSSSVSVSGGNLVQVDDSDNPVICYVAVDILGDQYQTVTVTVSDTPDPPGITVTYPNGGETLSGSVTITWTANDPDPGETSLLSIDLDYSSNGGDSWTSIATGESNDGSYIWNVSGLPDGSNYLLQATATDTSGLDDDDTSNGTFTIDNPDDPSISVTYPNGGETLSGSATITWSATDPDPGETALLSIDLDYSSNGGSSWTPIASGDANDGSYLWDVSGLPDGDNYLIRAAATDPTMRSDSDQPDAAFAIINTGPPVAITDLSATLAGNVIHLAWSAVTQDTGGISIVVDHYVIYRHADPVFTPVPADSVGGTPDIFYDDSTPALKDTGSNHYYVIKAVDSLGRKSTDSNKVGEFDISLINNPTAR